MGSHTTLASLCLVFVLVSSSYHVYADSIPEANFEELIQVATRQAQQELDAKLLAYKKAIDEELQKRDQAVQEKDKRKDEMHAMVEQAYEELDKINKKIEESKQKSDAKLDELKAAVQNPPSLRNEYYTSFFEQPWIKPVVVGILLSALLFYLVKQWRGAESQPTGTNATPKPTRPLRAPSAGHVGPLPPLSAGKPTPLKPHAATTKKPALRPPSAGAGAKNAARPPASNPNPNEQPVVRVAQKQTTTTTTSVAAQPSQALPQSLPQTSAPSHPQKLSRPSQPFSMSALHPTSHSPPPSAFARMDDNDEMDFD
jgi:DNA-binding protein H-NS